VKPEKDWEAKTIRKKEKLVNLWRDKGDLLPGLWDKRASQATLKEEEPDDR
jgi:hypothetical protein